MVHEAIEVTLARIGCEADQLQWFSPSVTASGVQSSSI